MDVRAKRGIADQAAEARAQARQLRRAMHYRDERESLSVEQRIEREHKDFLDRQSWERVRP